MTTEFTEHNLRWDIDNFDWVHAESARERATNLLMGAVSKWDPSTASKIHALLLSDDDCSFRNHEHHSAEAHLVDVAECDSVLEAMEGWLNHPDTGHNLQLFARIGSGRTD